MNNNINTLSGERLSFYKLFNEKQYKISIPIIQRDYAQGRKTTVEVRNIFLDALFNYLDENKPNRDLDFVYGSLNQTDGITEFVPLDGQQRLTTLFLLHWYLYQISENTEGKEKFFSSLFKNGKSMFTYETRSSSSEFCDALMGNNIDFDKLLKADENGDGKSLDNSLSKTIENSPWFFLSWKYDPTIKSMLTMLDAIHIKFANKKNYLESLINTEKPIITFLFLNLKDFKLTDDLYIKMNSRGKPLTSFENFKAKFEQHLENVDIIRKFKLYFNKLEKEVSLKGYFSYNIDTKWANLFWAYRDLSGDKNVYDEELKNFIRVIITNQYAISNEKDDKFEFLLGTQVAKKRKDYTDNISYYKYKELNTITEQSILYLIDAFDNLVNGNDKIKNHLSESYKFYYDENAVFENALKHSFANNQERILFHSYIRFLIENKNDRTGIEQWIRVIHNLANNTIIDGSDEICRAIKSIEKLLHKSNDILKYLGENPQIDFFSSWQVLEEKIKSHLITKNDNWKNIIEQTEKINCFDGQIGFVLEFAGILDYYEKKHNCNWTEQEDKNYFNSFVNYADKSIVVFKNKNNYNSQYAWERAVLTKGEYLIESSSCRKNLLTTDKNTRDYSWKRFLRITDEHKHKRLFVKQVFDDDLFDKTNLQNSLEKICEGKTNTWRDYLIDCPELIKYCEQGFIRFQNENDIILLGQSQMNHLHAEMYSLFLWKKYIKPRKDEFRLFNNIEYCYVKSSDGEACIVFSNFCHNRVYYEINIYYCNNDELPNPYEIAFRKSKGENTPDKYGDDIKNILTNLNFEWNEDYIGYFFSSEDSNTLMEKLEKLNEEINRL
ncbi:MAG: hypothetical protein H6Q16_1720 [Bacteroidetes bacterium]|nr:hypothetical protein [Bacteroidota bacterium]